MPDSVRASTWLGSAVCLATLMTVPGWAAETIGVERVRVPREQLSAILPAGVDLVSMPVAEFERLVREAEAGRQQVLDPRPRILAMTHAATWQDGRLRGSSTFEVEPHPDRPGEVEVTPWSPAVLGVDSPEPGDDLRTSDDGRIALRLAAGRPHELTIRWELTAPQPSDSRVFPLALPRSDLATLNLNLPVELVPRDSALKWERLDGTTAGRQSWQYRGPLGDPGMVLRLGAGDPGSAGAPLWVGGATRVTILEATADWEANWVIDAGGELLRPLEGSLDPGLELLGVQGDAVERYESWRADPRSNDGPRRFRVYFKPETRGPSPLRLLARTAVPGEGAWSIPGLSFETAQWTGGRTLVEVRAGRVVAAERVLSGLAVETSPEERNEVAAKAIRLAYQARSSTSPAVLEFRRPAVVLSAEIRGQVELGPQGPRLECVLLWSAPAGQRPYFLRADLPPRWTPERVSLSGVPTSPAWQVEPGVGGGSRLVVPVPSSLDLSRPFGMTVHATYSGTWGGAAPKELAFPRVVPVEDRVSDERWVIWARRGIGLRPVGASGLAWIDPAAVGLEPPSTADSGLAWRWISAAGRGAVSAAPKSQRPYVRTVQVVEIVGKRMRIQARVVIEASDDLETIPMRWQGTMPGGDWRLSTSGTDPVVRLATTGADRTGDFPLILDLPGSRRGRIVLKFSGEKPWDGVGEVPLLVIGPGFESDSTVLVGVERSVRSTTSVKGLRPLDPALSFALINPPGNGRADGEASLAVQDTLRWSHALGYSGDEPIGTLVLKTERLQTAGVGGVIREAVLSSPASPSGAAFHRLDLQVVPSRASEFTASLPTGAELQRLLVDGTEVVPARDGTAIVIGVATPTASRPSSAVVLEYTTRGREDRGRDELRAIPPVFSWPCLSLTWQLVATGELEVRASDRRLIRAGLEATPSWDTRLVRLDGLINSPSRPRLNTRQVAELSSQLPAKGRDGIMLGELILRWNSSGADVVVDRFALLSEGWSPRSRLVLEDPGSSGPAWLGTLKRSGLDLVPVGSRLLVTSTAGSRELVRLGLDAPRLLRAVRDAVIFGFDVTAQYQSGIRWAITDLPESFAGLAATDSLSNGGRLPTWLESLGWRDVSLQVGVLEPATRPMRIVTAAIAMMCLGLATAGLSPRRRARLWWPLMAAAGTGLLIDSSRPCDYGLGALLGGLAAMGYWLGRRGRGTSSSSPGDPPRASAAGSTLRRASAQAGLVAVILTIPWRSATPEPGQAPKAEPGPRIIAVYPFEPGREPTQVWLQRRDADQLQTWAGYLSAAPRPGLPVAAGARHFIEGGEKGSAVVVSEYELWVPEGGPPCAWSLPIGPSRELSASLDGRPVTLDLVPSGATGRIWLMDAGRHQLSVRRTIALDPTGGLTTLPLNRVPQAVVTLAPESDARPAGILAGYGTPSFTLGPSDRLTLASRSASAVSRSGLSGSADLLMVWDAEPAGDRVHARVTLRGGARSECRLILEAGLRPRKLSAPGLLEYELIPSESGEATLTARFDPPLPEGAALTLDLWRSPASLPAPDDPAPAWRRRAPRIDLMDVTARTTTLVLRRPVGWTGTMPTVEGTEAVGLPAIPKEWSVTGPTTMEPAGALRSPRPLDLAVTLQPVTPPGVLTPTATIAIQPGRLAIDFEGKIRNLRRPSQEIEVVLPQDWEGAEVAGEGLTAWSAEGTGRLRLRYDGFGLSERTIRLKGWVPADPASLDPTSQTHELTAPWPSWGGIRLDEGQLAVTSDRGVAFDVLAVPGSVRPVTAGSSTGPSGRVYTVARNPGSIRLSWRDEPVRTQVAVRSLVTLYPTEAELRASVRYRAFGGPLQSITLSLGDEWSERAVVSLNGLPADVHKERRDGLTYWTLRPEQPIWGAQQVVVHATRSYGADRGMPIPNLLPRGKGEVSALLLLANATGRPLITEGAGTQPIDLRRVQDDPDLIVPEHLPVEAYSVVSDRWRLAVQLDPDPTSARDDTVRTRVELADVSCAISPDGEVWGQSEFHLGVRPGAFLAVSFPPEARPIAAAVDGLPGRLLRGTDQNFLVPIENESARQVTLIWRGRIGLDRPEPAVGLPLPAPLAPQPVPAALVVRTPRGARATVTAPGLTPTGPAWGLARRAEVLSKRIVEEVARLDRGSTRQQGALLSQLVQFELAWRAADQSARAQAEQERGTLAAHEASRVQAALSSSRRSLTDAVQVVGLEDYLISARARLGLEPVDPRPDLIDLTPLPSSLRIRLLGKPTAYWSDAVDAVEPPVLQCSRDPVIPLANALGLDAETLPLLPLGALWSLAAAAVALSGSVEKISGRVGVLLYLTALAGIAWLAPLAALIGAAGVGWGALGRRGS